MRVPLQLRKQEMSKLAASSIRDAGQTVIPKARECSFIRGTGVRSRNAQNKKKSLVHLGPVSYRAFPTKPASGHIRRLSTHIFHSFSVTQLRLLPGCPQHSSR